MHCRSTEPSERSKAVCVFCYSYILKPLASSCYLSAKEYYEKLPKKFNLPSVGFKFIRMDNCINTWHGSLDCLTDIPPIIRVPSSQANTNGSELLGKLQWKQKGDIDISEMNQVTSM